jgi:hypothetical protein
MRLVVDRVVEPSPALLEDLDAWLRERDGDDWWRAFEGWRDQNDGA